MNFSIRRMMTVFLAVALLAGGCVFDDDNNDDSKKPSSIDELTVGGYVFVFDEEGYGLSQVITLKGDNPYQDATVFVNGIELVNNFGIHMNQTPLPLDKLKTPNGIRIAVYALGDSIVNTIAVPEMPVIETPAADATLTVGEAMPFRIGYPGAHNYIAFTILSQNVTYGVETDKTLVEGELPGSTLQNGGIQELKAYSVNVSGPIPDEGIVLTNPQELFLVASVVTRNLTFNAK